MSQTIVTQTGSLVNYANIISMSVEKGEILDESTGQTSEKVAVVGTDITGETLVFGAYDSFYTANSVFSEVVKWLKNNAFPLFEVPLAKEKENAHAV